MISQKNNPLKILRSLLSIFRPLKLALKLIICGMLFLLPNLVSAHGFAERYDLPVPLTLYLIGAGLTVALSFVVVSIFIGKKSEIDGYWRFNLMTTAFGRFLANRWIIRALQFLSISFLFITIISGFIGSQDPFENIAPTAVWVIWWVGFAYICGLIGNLWSVVNPWSGFYQLIEKSFTRLFPSKRFGIFLAWPKYLDRWPAVLLFVWFIWAELIWPQSDTPKSLAQAAVTYSIITWTGMFLFGRVCWLKNAEAFNLVFGFLARFSPMEFVPTDPSLVPINQNLASSDQNNKAKDTIKFEWNLRPWAVGLLGGNILSTASMVFVLIMLSSVTFDGFLATPLWASLSEWMIYSEIMRPLIIALQDIIGNAIAAVATISLFTFLVLFQLCYLLFSALMFWIVPRVDRIELSIMKIAKLFVLSLIPIALAYHLAHYLSYLAIVGQNIIPLASDPFGIGWDLFGTRLYMVDISVVNARLIWYVSVVAIVIGHILAVWLAHITAIRIFNNKRAALLSQIPMLVLMVAYTLLSLWILAQPVVES